MRASRQRQKAAQEHDGQEQEHEGADLRDEKLGEDVDAMLDEIDGCLADAAEEKREAEKRAREQAGALYEGIWAECLGGCMFHGSRGCTHRIQLKQWEDQYAGLFYWCCGEPVLDPDQDLILTELGSWTRGRD